MLVPALFLIVMALAGLAIDSSVLHSAHRSVHRSVSGAADDAAAMIDERHLQMTGELRIDPERASRVAAAQMLAASLPGELVALQTQVDPGGERLTVTATVIVERIFVPDTPASDGAPRLVVSSSARIAP